jgi:predicted amidohydrolase
VREDEAVSASAAPLTVAVGQIASGTDRGHNLRTIRRAATRARAGGAALLVLPEYAAFATKALDENIVITAEPLDGPFVAALAQLAVEFGLVIVAGMNEAVPGETRVHNTLVAVDASGTVLDVYRKIHLYDAFGQRESDWILPGAIEKPRLFPVAGVRVGLQTCYDLRFPEVTRNLATAGADLVAVPAQWIPGPGKVMHWRTLLAARAIENTVYVAAAGQAAPLGCGNSTVLDPSGSPLARCGTAPGVRCAPVDLSVIASVRERNPSVQLRRFDVVERAGG